MLLQEFSDRIRTVHRAVKRRCTTVNLSRSNCPDTEFPCVSEHIPGCIICRIIAVNDAAQVHYILFPAFGVKTEFNLILDADAAEPRKIAGAERNSRIRKSRVSHKKNVPCFSVESVIVRNVLKNSTIAEANIQRISQFDPFFLQFLRRDIRQRCTKFIDINDSADDFFHFLFPPNIILPYKNVIHRGLTGDCPFMGLSTFR